MWALQCRTLTHLTVTGGVYDEISQIEEGDHYHHWQQELMQAMEVNKVLESFTIVYNPISDHHQQYLIRNKALKAMKEVAPKVFHTLKLEDCKEFHSYFARQPDGSIVEWGEEPGKKNEGEAEDEIELATGNSDENSSGGDSNSTGEED